MAHFGVLVSTLTVDLELVPKLILNAVSATQQKLNSIQEQLELNVALVMYVYSWITNSFMLGALATTEP